MSEFHLHWLKQQKSAESAALRYLRFQQRIIAAEGTPLEVEVRW